MLGYVRCLRRVRPHVLRGHGRGGLYPQRLAALSKERNLCGRPQDHNNGGTQSNNAPTKTPTTNLVPLDSSGKLQFMTAAKDKQLTGSVLLSFVKACNLAGIDAGQTQERVGDFLQSRAKGDHHSQSRQAYQFVLRAWKDLAREKPQLASKEAEKMLYEMLTLYLEDKNVHVKPCRQCFTDVLAIHNASGNATAADRVLQDMIHLYDNTQDKDFLPDKQCFSWVLLSLFNEHKSTDNAFLADNVLHQMMELAIATGDATLRPPESVVQHALTLWARSYHQDAGFRAEALLIRMQELPDSTNSITTVALPPVKFFELVMQAWAKSEAPKAAARIEQIQLFVKEQFDVLPPCFGDLIVLEAYAKSSRGNKDAIRKVDQYFRQFQQHFRSEHVSSLDVILAYRCKIIAYSNHKDPLKGARECQAALEELWMLRKKEWIEFPPDSTVYEFVAYAWAKIGNVHRVKDLLHRIKQDRQGQEPNIVLYNHLLMALSRSRDPHAGQEAEKVFLELQKKSQKGDRSARPNIHTYGTLMACLSKSPNPKTASRAALYLQKLKELHEITGDQALKPNARIYTTAMRSLVGLANQEAVEKAQALLDEMHALAQQGDETSRPDVVTYTTFLKVLRVSNVPDKRERAEQVLLQMKEHGIQPDAFVWKEVNKLVVQA
ncbi:Pentatricopeptide repeat-containing protein [Seminavis robusta]|uniref:Pentatricopeptide repeat-containing protein n=1 Tax=Seminavis robusta TaxID=568900 RepID=A0A9N8DTB2_9STRA|nr:Pentatricopeptide repeat-containing protein [Seminavis robusta]|eukprot:Sro355_g125050.1 Pentatricopeptide repeat-containing protein (662) ;mRNA; f:27021-29006